MAEGRGKRKIANAIKSFLANIESGDSADDSEDLDDFVLPSRKKKNRSVHVTVLT